MPQPPDAVQNLNFKSLLLLCLSFLGLLNAIPILEPTPAVTTTVELREDVLNPKGPLAELGLANLLHEAPARCRYDNFEGC